MNAFRADLHSHTTCSDGTFTPEELVHHAKEIGLSGLSITDHDTVEAYARAIPVAKELDITLIPGVEFSTMFNGESIHILGYGIDLQSPKLQSFCESHNQRRLQRNRRILEKLKQSRMPITEEEIRANLPKDPNASQRTIGRPHIARAMVKRGYVATIEEAFKKFLAEGRPCYSTGPSFSTKESIDIIHECGGIAILAHPHLINNPPILKGLLTLPFDGIEVYYANFPPEKNEPWLKIAQERNWLITGGSDFHGTVKPKISLGCSTVNEEIFQNLLNFK